MKGALLLRTRRSARRNLSHKTRRLLAEKLEDRALLAGDSCADVVGASQLLEAEGEGPAAPLVQYQIRLVPPGGALFMRDPLQSNVLIPTPDLTAVNVGDSYDLAVTVTTVEPGQGVFAGYLDIGYDSSKTRVRVGEVQNLRIDGLVGSGNSTSGSFSLTFDGETTAPISFSANPATLAASIQKALASLPKIGEGNVNVRAAQSTSSLFMIRFVSKLHDQNVPNLTIAGQDLTGSGSLQLSVTYEGDLQSGITPLAFKEAFRSWGGPGIAGLASEREYYPNGLSAADVPNLLDDVGAFSTVDSPYPGELTSAEIAAGFLAAPPRELVRARMFATTTGTITFSPDVVNVLRPAYDTLIYADPSVTPKIAPDRIDTGGSRSLIVTGGPIVAAADFATVMAGSSANAIAVLGNDSTFPGGQEKAVVAVTQPASGTVTFTASGVVYTPQPNFLGQESFTYTVRNMTAGADSPTATAVVTVAVVGPISAVADAATMVVNTLSTTIDVLANDATTPATGQTKSIVSVTQPGRGAASIVDNKVVYQPEAEYSGTDTFTYTARNMTAGESSRTSTATVTVTINPASSAVVQYQVRLVPTNGALFMPDPLNPHSLIPTPDLTTVTIGDTYDVAVTVASLDPKGRSVFSGFLDLGYDSSLTQVQVGEVQYVTIGPFTKTNPASSASGTFRLEFGGQWTRPILYSSDPSTLAARIRFELAVWNEMGVDNLDVANEGSTSTGQLRIRVRFGGKFLGLDVPNMTVAEQDLRGPTEPVVGVTYEGDLQSGGTNLPVAFVESFRSRGIPTVSTVPSGHVFYTHNVGGALITWPAATTIQPNLIDDLGAISHFVADGVYPSVPTSAERAAGFTVAPPRELVRARFKATALGELTFVPDVSKIDPGPIGVSPKGPKFATKIYGREGVIPPEQIDVGALRTLTIVGPEGPFKANPDTVIVHEDWEDTPLNVLVNDTIFDYQSMSLHGFTQPTIGMVFQAENDLIYRTAKDFFGTVTLEYTGTNGWMQNPDFTSTAKVTIVVVPVNDEPSFVKGPDQDVTDESGPVSVAGWATQISAGPANEADQVVSFLVTVNDYNLFSVPPAIDASGRLTYTPAKNAEGTAVVTVWPMDNGGVENGGNYISGAVRFEIRIVKLHPMHNAAKPQDIGGDGQIAANDALDVINFLNAFGSDQVAKDIEPEMGFLDVNADGYITAADPLEVINYLNARGAISPPPSNGEGEGKGGETADDDSTLISLLAFDAVESTTRRRQRS